METCGLVTLLASTVSIRNVCQCMVCTQGEENSRLTEEGHIVSDDAGNLQLRLILRHTDETCLHATAKNRLLGNMYVAVVEAIRGGAMNGLGWRL
jgi:hypothetical protein